MLVYGDRIASVDPRTLLAAVAGSVEAARLLPPGIERHGLVATAFLDAALLAQGLADRGGGEAEAAAIFLLRALAGSLGASWRAAFSAGPPDVAAALEQLAGALDAIAPDRIACRSPEGYAQYALYPEAYGEAARPLAGRLGAAVGIRSIGLGLAAIVAEAAGIPVLLSCRPEGHPFRRVLPDRALAGLRGVPGEVAIVDEGPGLSGSSFACVGAAVAALPGGRAAHVFCSHDGGPGPEADPATRHWWDATPRHVVPFADVLLPRDGGPRHLARWFDDLLGEARSPLAEISGGAWRQRLAGAATMPAAAGRERRKFIREGAGGAALLRFVGLGRHGEAARRRAEAMATTGIVQRPLGLRHGFLAEAWHPDARPLGPDAGADPAFRHTLARYVGARARLLPAPDDAPPGATLAELAAMLVVNVREGLGIALDAEELAARAAALAPRVRAVETDNRMQPWEWIETGQGVRKTDATDHCADHDLVGCQDIAWDVAGAAAEFGLDPDRREALRREASRIAGRSIDPDLVAFLLPCHLAHQLGLWTFARAAADAGDRPAIDARLAVLRRDLVRWLDGR